MESAGVGTPKVQWSLQPTPGCSIFVVAGAGPIRDVWSEDGRVFCVSGGAFYELFGSQTATLRGSVAADNNPATISSNGEIGGHQLFITSGLKGYVYDLDANTLTLITDPAFPTYVSSGLFFDGYFIALDAVTGKFLISTLEDGTSWNGLDFGAESQFSAKVIQILKVHDQLWLFSSNNIALWYDSGAPDFPFQPTAGQLIEHGIAAPWSACVLANTIIWLGLDINGTALVWMASGTTPQRVSTTAVEWDLRPRSGVNLAAAIGYTLQFLGHTCYALSVPGRPWTWVFDTTSGQWFKWAHWIPQSASWVRHVARCHAFGFNTNLVGDRQSGAIYALSPATSTDTVVSTSGIIEP